MNTWLHRITGGDYALPLSWELLEKGYISIGWSDFSSEENLAKLRESGSSFDKLFVDSGWGLPRNRWNLWRFITEMKPGDIVLVPRPQAFSIYRIADDKVFTVETIAPDLLTDWNGNKVCLSNDGYLRDKDDNIVDLGFFRRVEPLELNIPRGDYADQALYSRMKIRQTNANINDLLGSINTAVENFRRKRPINLKASIEEETIGIILEKIRNLQNDSKFEDLVQWYLESLGGDVIKPSKNESPTEAGDADRVAIFDKLGVAIMVQVKKHDGQTGSWAIDQINAYRKNHNYDDYTTIMWVITSGESFSEDAEQLAQASGVKLIDGKKFAKMILENGLDGLQL